MQTGRLATETLSAIPTLEVRPNDRRQEQEEVVYDNRIFNVKKKYTMPTERPDHHTHHQQQQSAAMPKFKHSSYFSKYLDSINKNHPLLRRGACDAALPNTLTNRNSRIKTESSCISKKIVCFRSVNNSQTSKKLKEQEWKPADLKSTHKNLPSLSVRGTCRTDELVLPIRVEQFVFKGVHRPKQQSGDEGKQEKKLMLRRLQVQLINYSLLGKWVNSSLKS